MAFIVTTDKPIKVYKKSRECNGKEFWDYYTTIKSRNQLGNLITCYVNLKFCKKDGEEVELPNESFINIIDGFYSFNPFLKQGYKYPFIFIRQYEITKMGSDVDDKNNPETIDYDEVSFV